MDIIELKDDIETILEKEYSDFDGSDQFNHCKSWAIDSNSKKILYPNAERLLRLWTSLLEDKSKAFFKATILSGVVLVETERESSYYANVIQSASQLCFYIAIKIGYINEALNALENRVTLREPSTLIFDLVKDNLSEFLLLLNRTQINTLHRILESSHVSSDHEEKKQTFLKKLLDERIYLLDTKLDKINVEINQDKSTLIKKISDWGFDEKYNSLLDSVDKYILSDDPHINSGMISNLRTFMSDFAIELSEKIALREREEIPKYKEVAGIQPIGRSRRYIKEKLNLSKEEHDLYDNFINVLHDSGGHSFSSDKEYFRLARNMVIELALFLMTKYTRKYPEKTAPKKSKIFLGMKI